MFFIIIKKQYKFFSEPEVDLKIESLLSNNSFFFIQINLDPIWRRKSNFQSLRSSNQTNKGKFRCLSNCSKAKFKSDIFNNKKMPTKYQIMF